MQDTNLRNEENDGILDTMSDAIKLLTTLKNAKGLALYNTFFDWV